MSDSDTPAIALSLLPFVDVSHAGSLWGRLGLKLLVFDFSIELIEFVHGATDRFSYYMYKTGMLQTSSKTGKMKIDITMATFSFSFSFCSNNNNMDSNYLSGK